MTRQSDYQRALEMAVIASQHAERGYRDMARRLLVTADHDGHFDDPQHLCGKLLCCAVEIRIDFGTTRGAKKAAAKKLRELLPSIASLRSEEEREMVLEQCEAVMARLDHIGEIKVALKKANAHVKRFEYVEAFTQLAAAQGLLQQHVSLVPRRTAREIADAHTSVMNHLLRNNNAQQVMAIMRNLRSLGLVAE